MPPANLEHEELHARLMTQMIRMTSSGIDSIGLSAPRIPRAGSLKLVAPFDRQYQISLTGAYRTGEGVRMTDNDEPRLIGSMELVTSPRRPSVRCRFRCPPERSSLLLRKYERPLGAAGEKGAPGATALSPPPRRRPRHGPITAADRRGIGRSRPFLPVLGRVFAPSARPPSQLTGALSLARSRSYSS